MKQKDINANIFDLVVFAFFKNKKKDAKNNLMNIFAFLEFSKHDNLKYTWPRNFAPLNYFCIYSNRIPN